MSVRVFALWGVVIVRDGEIVDSFYSLIQPEPNYYNYWCTQVHGLTRQDTHNYPTTSCILYQNIVAIIIKILRLFNLRIFIEWAISIPYTMLFRGPLG